MTLCLSSSACAKSEIAVKAPTANLAQSGAAQQVYRELERIWYEGTERDRQMLEPRLNSFVASYSNDPSVRRVQLWRAWLAVSRSEYARAIAWVDQASADNDGASRDAAKIIRAAIYTRQGHADEALRLLEPLVGMIVDAQERDDWAREIIQATLKLKHDDDALKWALVWRLECSEDRRVSVERYVTRMLDNVSRAALERLWVQLEMAERLPSTISGRKQGRSWMRGAVTSRLAHFAIYNQDAALAQRLLDDPSLSMRTNVSLRRLARVAARAETETQGIGRKLGIIIDLDSPQQRRRSSELVTGILQTLDTLSESDRALLLTREASRSDPDEYEEAINDLYNDGAAIIIGGLDSGTADALAIKSRPKAIPVITMAPLSNAARGDYSFWIDTTDRAAETLWHQNFVHDDKQSVVIEDSDAACADGADAPFDMWRKRHVEAVYLACGATCSERLGQAAGQSERVPHVWLGPKAAAGMETWPANNLGGVVTFTPLSLAKPNDPTYATWLRRFSREPHYYEILGRDVTMLAVHAMREIPKIGSSLNGSRAEVMYGIAQRLLVVRERLWSSSMNGFANDHSLTPTYAAQSKHESDPGLGPGKHDAAR